MRASLVRSNGGGTHQSYRGRDEAQANLFDYNERFIVHECTVELSVKILGFHFFSSRPWMRSGAR